MKPENVLRWAVAMFALGGLVVTWTLSERNLFSQTFASSMFALALWGLGSGGIRLRGVDIFIEDRPYRFCILMLVFCVIGFVIVGPGLSW